MDVDICIVQPGSGEVLTGIERTFGGKELEVMSKRIASSMIISALIIASALVIQSGAKPFVCGVPVLGITGFVIAGILGMGLVLSIMRSGRF